MQISIGSEWISASGVPLFVAGRRRGHRPGSVSRPAGSAKDVARCEARSPMPPGRHRLRRAGLFGGRDPRKAFPLYERHAWRAAFFRIRAFARFDILLSRVMIAFSASFVKRSARRLVVLACSAFRARSSSFSAFTASILRCCSGLSVRPWACTRISSFNEVRNDMAYSSPRRAWRHNALRE